MNILSNEGQRYIEILAKVAELLELENISTGTYITALYELVEENTKTIDFQFQMNETTRLRKAQLQQFLAEKEEIERLMQHIQDATVLDETSDVLRAKIQECQEKQAKYIPQIAKLEKILKERHVMGSNNNRWYVR